MALKSWQAASGHIFGGHAAGGRIFPAIPSGEKGQAAVTDALYFLMIVTFLSIFLFGFANSYGNTIKEKISNEYSTTFTTNALKTILYASTPRDAAKTVYDNGAEIDYLLAAIKEDYSDDAAIGPTEQVVLGRTILSVMRPIADTKDYAFTISIRPQEQSNRLGSIAYIFFHTTNFETDSAALQGKALAKDYLIEKPGSPHHRDYLCSPKDGDYAVISKRLSRLFANIGPTAQSSAQIKLVKENPGKGTWDDFRAQADLISWDASWLGQTRDRTAGLFYDTANRVQGIPPEWGCTELGAQPTAGP